MKILLVSISARHVHKQLAAWCLKAYCEQEGKFTGIEILEQSINENLMHTAAEIIKRAPAVIALSCYIWNMELIEKLVPLLKQMLPESIIVLGGPEVSFEEAEVRGADYILRGAGEASFLDLMLRLQAGERPETRVREEIPVRFADMPSPFTEAYLRTLDAANQLVYMETSRGCPFQCSYCLSSVTSGVSFRPLAGVFADIERLTHAGARCIKFVDRTFNADRRRAAALWRFIAGLETACTFHFEIAAALLDEKAFAIIAGMPAGRVQFEIGVQSVNAETLAAVHRADDTARVLENIARLSAFGNCRVHADLIAGMPHETYETMWQGIEAVLEARPHVLQLGFLKLLKGSDLRARAGTFSCRYTAFAPYEVLQTSSMQFADLQRLKAADEVLDVYYNSRYYSQTLHFAAREIFGSMGSLFEKLAEYCRKHGGLKITQKRRYTLLMQFLMQYAPEAQIKHFIKLDCLTYDPKGILPDGMEIRRDKQKEALWRKKTGFSQIRVEMFSFDEKQRLFVYDKKHPVSLQYHTSII